MDTPSLTALGLLKWKDEHGCVQEFRLASKVSSRWKDFGQRLGMSWDELKVLDRKNLMNDKDSWRDVMNSWLSCEVKSEQYPTTWEGLYTLLKDLELSQYAQQMEKAVKGYCPS